MITQKDYVISALYYNITQSPSVVADRAGIPAPSARRVLRELEDSKKVRWVAGDHAVNRMSGYVRV